MSDKKKKLNKNQRSDGRYCVRITVTDEYGKKKQKSFYGLTQREAKENARIFQQELEQGLNLNERTTTVRQWMEQWVPLATSGKSLSTKNIYTNIGSYVTDCIGSIKMREVREAHLQKILNSLEGYSKSYIAKARMIIRAAFAAAERNGIIPKSPAAYLETPKGTYVGHRALEPWEISLILENWRIHRGGFWMALMLLSGLRRGEACALRIADYDQNLHILTINNAVHAENNRMVESGTTKTEAGIRDIPVVEPLRSIMAEFLATHEQEYFLVDTRGLTLSETAFKRGWDGFRIAIEKIANGRPPDVAVRKKSADWTTVYFTPHDLRYTFATMLYDANVDEKSAQIWMGHTSPEMTRGLYAQLTAERKSRSTSSLEKYMRTLHVPPDTT